MDQATVRNVRGRDIYGESSHLSAVQDVLSATPQQRYEGISRKFPRWLLTDPIQVPRELDSIYWHCSEDDCDNDPGATGVKPLCAIHSGVRDQPEGHFEFYGTCVKHLDSCQLCPDRDAEEVGLCQSHADMLRKAMKSGIERDTWELEQKAFPPTPDCFVNGCIRDTHYYIFYGDAKVGSLCDAHIAAWKKASTPPLPWTEWLVKVLSRMNREGGDNHGCSLSRCERPPSREATDSSGEVVGELCLRHYRMWAGSQAPRPTPQDWAILELASRRMIKFEDRHTLNLARLPANLAREIRFAIYRHINDPRRTPWLLSALRRAIHRLEESGVESVQEPRLLKGFEGLNRPETKVFSDLVTITRALSLTAEVSREEGWFDPALVGAKPFRNGKSSQRRTPYDLGGIHQPWLRNMLWDYIRSAALKTKAPTKNSILRIINGTLVTSHLLRSVCPDEGLDPALLDATTARGLENAFEVALTQQTPLPRQSGGMAPLTGDTMRTQMAQAAFSVITFGANTLPASAHEFITNLPRYRRPYVEPNPRPLDDELWRALTSEESVARLDERDPEDVGLVDIWLTHAWHGSRISEARELPLHCLVVIGGQPFFFRDPTKVGKIGHGVACHPVVYQRLLARQEKTKAKLRERYADDLAQMSPQEIVTREHHWGRTMPMFPARIANRDLQFSVSSGHLEPTLREWIGELGLGEHVTTHQTRHTLCTALLNNGAPPDVLQDLFGWMSHKMVKAYGRYDDTTRVEPLRQVWAQGPGMPNPGRAMLTPDDLDEKDQATFQRTHVDLAAVPVEGGLCQYGPVVGGKTCPWGKNCTTDPKKGPCQFLLLSGADYAYWNRKHEAAVTWAEGAPTEETREYILEAWSGWSEALDGLRMILDDLDLLNAAEDLDLRSPRQDYLGDPLWTQAWSMPEISAEPESVLDIREQKEAEDG